MINDTNDFDQNQNTSEANIPFEEAESLGRFKKIREKISNEKVKDYGQKSLLPILNVVHKYQDDITPYLSAITKGLSGAASVLNKKGESSSEADRFIGQWFQEASDWIEGAQEKVKAKDSKELLNYIQTQAQRNPGIMFSASYAAGLILGRLGRHIGIKVKGSGQSQREFSDSNENIGEQPLTH